MCGKRYTKSASVTRHKRKVHHIANEASPNTPVKTVHQAKIKNLMVKFHQFLENLPKDSWEFKYLYSTPAPNDKKLLKAEDLVDDEEVLPKNTPPAENLSHQERWQKQLFCKTLQNLEKEVQEETQLLLALIQQPQVKHGVKGSNDVEMEEPTDNKGFSEEDSDIKDEISLYRKMIEYEPVEDNGHELSSEKFEAFKQQQLKRKQK